LAAEDARMKAGLKTAEDELNLIKNQVQQTLLDIREHILDATNPFNAIDSALTDEDDIEFGDDLMGGGAGGAGGAGGSGSGGDGGGDGGGDSDEYDDEGNAVASTDDDDLLDEEELLDDELEDPGEEIIEEIPDDGYYDEQIVDDGGGGGGAMSSGYGDTEEVFEEEEVIADEDEGFELDEEEPTEEEIELAAAEAAEEAGEVAAGAQTAGVDGTVAAAAMIADFDVLTMAGLVRWVAVTTDRLGANRTEILLDAFEAAGRIAPATRSVLHHLMALTEEDPGDSVPVREIVSAMVRMEGVLETTSGDNSDSTRLLTMLMDVEDDPIDRLIA
jgi:hypothetical protein